MDKFAITCDFKKNQLLVKPLGSVSLQASYDKLKELAAKGAIFYEEKQLIVDLFTPVQFFYEVKDGELRGKFRVGKDVIDTTECKCIVPSSPIWFIYGNRLKVVKSEVSWLELTKLPRKVTWEEIEEIKEEEIEVQIQGAPPKAKEPLPVFKLSDRTGAFGNLWIDYEGKQHLFQFESNKNDGERFWEKDLLETGYQRKKVNATSYYCPLDQVGKSLTFLLELGWKVLDGQGREIVLQGKKAIELVTQDNTVVMRGKIGFGEYQADLSKVLGTFNRREKFIDLGEGKVGLLQGDGLLSSLAEEVEIVSERVVLTKERLGLLDEEILTWAGGETLKNLLLKDHVQTPPSNLFNGELRPYQKEGLSWLQKLASLHFHGILADDMGLGKTVQMLAFLSVFSEDLHLVVVPTTLLPNWEKEIEKFLPSFSIYKHHGKEKKESLPESGIVITSYQTLKNDAALFTRETWKTIILDEAQIIKNPDTQIAKTMFSLKGEHKFSMTGTVIENHVSELWSHFRFLMPGLFPSREVFEKELQLGTIDSRYLKKIQKMIRPFILRRRKEEVAKDLPPLQEVIQFVEMETTQRAAYDNFLAATKQGLLKKVQLEGGKKHRMEIFEAILRLRQLACHPLLFNEEAPSAKFEALFLDLEELFEEGKKGLIFSQFASMLHLIARELKARNIPYVILEGDTVDRKTPVDRFQEDPAIPFFLITLKAGGVGLNLTAADYVFIYDPWWHEAAEMQAIARAHRIGQNKPVIAKRYITIESVEEKMLTLKKAKSSLFSALLEGDLHDSHLGEEDLLFLLNDQT